MFEVNGHTSQIVSSLTRIIKNIWSDNWGPRSEWLLENLSFALLTTDHPHRNQPATSSPSARGNPASRSPTTGNNPHNQRDRP